MIAPITIQAIYRDGKLQPQTKLDLPDNTPVQVLVLPLTVEGRPTLFGAFPELLSIGGELERVKQLLADSLDKQLKMLDGTA